LSENTAFTVHLAGAFFALGYYRFGWNFRSLPDLSIGSLQRRVRDRSRKMSLNTLPETQKRRIAFLQRFTRRGKLASLRANGRHSNDTVVFKERKEIASE
ncbi:hypothetical protein N9M41_08150, partial [Rhodopirellula sp.]|nr:hypothetical protein [Rhodopirellula sp.]